MFPIIYFGTSEYTNGRSEQEARKQKNATIQQSERNRLEPFGDHQLKQLILEPVWNLEPQTKISN